jgi:hypothetical protein
MFSSNIFSNVVKKSDLFYNIQINFYKTQGYTMSAGLAAINPLKRPANASTTDHLPMTLPEQASTEPLYPLDVRDRYEKAGLSIWMTDRALLKIISIVDIPLRGDLTQYGFVVHDPKPNEALSEVIGTVPRPAYDYLVPDKRAKGVQTIARIALHTLNSYLAVFSPQKAVATARPNFLLGTLRDQLKMGDYSQLISGCSKLWRHQRNSKAIDHYIARSTINGIIAYIEEERQDFSKLTTVLQPILTKVFHPPLASAGAKEGEVQNSVKALEASASASASSDPTQDVPINLVSMPSINLVFSYLERFPQPPPNVIQANSATATAAAPPSTKKPKV